MLAAAKRSVIIGLFVDFIPYSRRRSAVLIGHLPMVARLSSLAIPNAPAPAAGRPDPMPKPLSKKTAKSV
jgi:hypothetical protein